MSKYEWRKPTAEQRQWLMDKRRTGHLLALTAIQTKYMGETCNATTFPSYNVPAKTLEIRLVPNRLEWPEGFPLWPEDPNDLGHGPLVDEARARIEAGEFDTRKLGEAHSWKKPNIEWVVKDLAEQEAVAEAKENQARLREKKDRLERLRDEFAKECMGSLSLHDDKYTPEQVAELSYRYADAMLKARENK